jgi:membrane protease YdiL (CAAX protease family)
MVRAAWAQSAAPEPSEAPAPTAPGAAAVSPSYTRGQTVALSLLSGAFSAGSFFVNLVPSPEIFGVHGYYDYATETAADVPLLAVSPADGLGVGGLQLAGIASAVSLRYAAARNATFRPYFLAVDNISAHIALWGTYATYRDMRLQGGSDAWNDDWHPSFASELLVAPFLGANLKHPIVYVPLLALTGLEATIGLAAHSSETFRAGPALRDSMNGVALSFSAGVTEEALFRGVFYEELQISLGRWPARIIDSTAFSLWHIPGELGVQSTSLIVGGTVVRAGLSVLFETAYDQGGLPEAVALHALWDSSCFIFAAVTGKPVFGSDAMPARAGSGGNRGLALFFPLASGVF